jgi:hypothetical protein
MAQVLKINFEMTSFVQVDMINWRQNRTDTRGAWIQAVKITVYGYVSYARHLL